MTCPICYTPDAAGSRYLSVGRTFRCIRCGNMLRMTRQGPKLVDTATELDTDDTVTVQTDGLGDPDDSVHRRDTQIVRAADIKRPAHSDADNNQLGPKVRPRRFYDDSPTAVGPTGEYDGDTRTEIKPTHYPSPSIPTAPPPPPVSDVGFDDAVTGILNAGDLQKRLDEMRADQEEEEARERHREAAQRHGSTSVESSVTLVSRFERLPLSAKTVVGSLGLAVCTLAAVVGFQAWRDAARTAYATDVLPLLAGPGPRKSFGELGVLERGERVTIYNTVGEYAMVSDTMGRAGYVTRAGLSRSPPEILPELPFSGCRQTPTEADLAPCLARAQGQLKSCRSFCERDAVTPKCFEDCSRRHRECQRSCIDPKDETSPSSKTSASREPAVPAPQAAGKAQPYRDGEHVGADDDGQKKKRKLRKKRKRTLRVDPVLPFDE